MIYVILGQTASGKTSLALKLAKEFNLPLINCDAFQCYKQMNIGTAKPKKEELENVEHYFINNIDITDAINVKKFQEQGRQLIDKLTKENKDIIISGGTSLYIKALLFNYEFPDIDNKIYDELSLYPLDELLKILEELDIETYNNIDKNNKRRVVTAVALAKNNYSRDDLVKKFNNKPLYPCLFFNIDIDKEDINEKIDSRVETMFFENLVNEIEYLIQNYDYNKLNAFKAIGYKEFLNYINEDKTIDKSKLEQIKQDIKTHTHQYAKRQRTFIKTQFSNVKNLSPEEIYSRIMIDQNIKKRTKLMLDQTTLGKIENMHFLVCGLGGVGSLIPEYLVRLGAKNIDILDFDKVDLTNLNRQISYNLDDVGKDKTDVISEKLAKINPSVTITSLKMKLDKSNMIDKQYDFIFDCIDSIEGKAYLTKYSIDNNIPIIVSGGAGKKIDSTKTKYEKITKSNDVLIKKFLEYLQPLLTSDDCLNSIYCVCSNDTNIKTKNKTISSIPTVPNSFGLAMISFLLKRVVGGF